MKTGWPEIRQHWRDDLIAGMTGAVAGAPQAMGFALIAGVNPVYGLYSAVVATIVGAGVGSSTYMTVGPTNALALVVASTLGGYSGAAQIDRLFVLTLLVGAFFALFALLRLGFLVRFVSNAVMTGFITGAGLLIVFGQVSHLNGYDPAGDTALLRFIDWLLHLPQSNPQTSVIGLGALATMLAIQRTRFRNLATLTAIAGASLTVAALRWGEVALVRDISAVPLGLPTPILPDLSLAPELAAAALAIAVLGAVQSAAITNSLPQPDGSRAHTSRDLLGMGLANMLGGVFQGMPTCGSLSRTAVNVRAGARTHAANLYAGGFVALFLLLLGGAVEQVTLAALAAQLILAAISLLKPGEIALVWRTSPAARIAMSATFISTLVLPLEYSIYVGVVLSLALYAYTSARDLTVVQLQPTDDGRFRTADLPEKLPAHDTLVISVHGSLYFAAVYTLEAHLPDPATCEDSTVILRLREVNHLGSTALHLLHRYQRALQAHGGRLMLSGVSPVLHAELVRTGYLTLFGEQNVFDAHDIVFDSTLDALNAANTPDDDA